MAVHWGKPLICSLENYIWGHCAYKLFLVWHLTGVLTLVWLCVSSTYSHVPAFFDHFSHSLGRCHPSGCLATGTSLAVPALPGALCLRSLSTAGWSHPGCGRWGAGPRDGKMKTAMEGEVYRRCGCGAATDFLQPLVVGICWLDPFRFG